MKKKIVLAALILFSLLTKTVSAQQSPKFNDVTGINLLNAGIGIGSYGLSGTGGLPLTASFEHGFSKNISAGLEAGLVQRKYVDAWKYSYFIIGVRGSYYFSEMLNV